MFTNQLNMGLPLQTWVEKTVYGLKTYDSLSKSSALGRNKMKETLTKEVQFKRFHHFYNETSTLLLKKSNTKKILWFLKCDFIKS